MALNVAVLDHYNCRKRLHDVSLQKRFTPEEQEIRNLYEYYYSDDPDMPAIRLLSRECLEFRRLKQELTSFAR